MRGGRVKALAHEFFQAHPFTMIIDSATPRSNPHEFFQITDAIENPAGGGGHYKPDRQHQKHLQRGPTV